MFLKKALLFLFFSASITLSSHEFSPAHLIMDEKMETNYEATWMYPIRSIGEEHLCCFLRTASL